MSQGGTVLIPDDDPVWAESVTRLLEPDRSRRVPDQGGQLELTLPPVRVFRFPAQGILEEFLHRRNAA